MLMNFLTSFCIVSALLCTHSSELKGYVVAISGTIDYV